MSVEVKTINLSTVINVQTLWESPTRREKKIRTRSLAEAKLEQFCLGCICHPNLKFKRGGKIKTHTLAHTLFTFLHLFMISRSNISCSCSFLFFSLNLSCPRALVTSTSRSYKKEVPLSPFFPFLGYLSPPTQPSKIHSFVPLAPPPPPSSRIPVLHRGR